MISLQWLDQRLMRKFVLAVGVVLVACVTPLYAQQNEQLTSPKIEGKFIFGGATFGDDDDHKLVGGALRVYVTKRLSIEPEYLYLRDSVNDQDQLIQPNIAYDFTDPTQRLVAYGIVGVGVLHHKGRFVDRDIVTGATRVFDTSFTTWTATVGAGAKIFVTKRLFVSPEVRLGRQPTLRGTISVGYVFGGRR